jgi:hypothetical protein
MINFDNLDAELSLADIRQVEKELKVKFPQVLVDHYLEWNGGFPDHCIYQHDDERNQVCIEQCLPLKTDNKNHTTAQAAYRNLQKREVPANYFPFGIDPCGAYFLVDLTDPNHEVYFYQTDVTPPKLEACLRPLDAGFEDFWQRLGPDID